MCDVERIVGGRQFYMVRRSIFGLFCVNTSWFLVEGVERVPMRSFSLASFTVGQFESTFVLRRSHIGGIDESLNTM